MSTLRRTLATACMLFLFNLRGSSAGAQVADGDWLTYNRTLAGDRFSPLRTVDWWGHRHLSRRGTTAHRRGFRNEVTDVAGRRPAEPHSGVRFALTDARASKVKFSQCLLDGRRAI
jgi:hypothetical protein